MRRASFLLPLSFALPALLLASCKGEADFDERYQRKAEDLEAAANSMQQELENRMAARNRIEAATGSAMPEDNGMQP